MNIGVFTHSRFPADDRIEREIKTLIKEGHKVYVFANKTGSDTRDNFEVEEVEVNYFKPIVSATSFPFLFEIINIFRLLPAYKKIKHLDVIHINDLSLIFVLILSKLVYRKPTIIDVHEGWPELVLTYSRNFILKYSSYLCFLLAEFTACFLADHYVTIIDDEKRKLVRRWSVIQDLADKIVIVRNVPELRDLNPESPGESGINMPADRFIITYFGGINGRHRGLDLLIDASKELRDIPLVFLIIGEGRYREKLEGEVEDNKLEEMFIFTGFKPLSEGVKLIKGSDVCIIPYQISSYIDKSLPNKIFLYMALGKPVIATPLKSFKRLFPNTLIFVEPPTPHNLAEKIKDIYDDPIKYGEYGRRGQKLVSEEFNWERESRKLTDIYSEISIKIQQENS